MGASPGVVHKSNTSCFRETSPHAPTHESPGMVRGEIPRRGARKPAPAETPCDSSLTADGFIDDPHMNQGKRADQDRFSGAACFVAAICIGVLFLIAKVMA